MIMKKNTQTSNVKSQNNYEDYDPLDLTKQKKEQNNKMETSSQSAVCSLLILL